MPRENNKYIEPKLEEKPVTSWTIVCPKGYEDRYIGGTQYTSSGTFIINSDVAHPYKPDLADHVCVSTSKATAGSE